MERSNKSKPLWIKKTTGTLILRTPLYLRLKHKQKFHATPEELGRHIDDFELLEGAVDLKKYPQQEEKIAPASEEYKTEHIGAGWYNVISPTNEIMNEKKLRADEAADLVKELEKQQDV